MIRWLFNLCFFTFWRTVLWFLSVVEGRSGEDLVKNEILRQKPISVMVNKEWDSLYSLRTWVHALVHAHVHARVHVHYALPGVFHMN